MAQEDADGDQVGDACDSCTDTDDFDNICVGDICPSTFDPNQKDTYPPDGNGIGDACECEADFDCNGNVDADDVTLFLIDFGRNTFNDPCPACVAGVWCSY